MERHGFFIIGTAGHVDHGKTALVRALTGHDPDRLPEEKERGITIDLGFAPFQLPDGHRAGLIDVPGHERFIKNMLAGAGGVDLALLVVAADEGVMPQTREHLYILDLLGVKAGVIAVTKRDLVDADWLELVKEDIRQTVTGTFLADAPVVAVSAVTREGLTDLVQAIVRATDFLSPRPAEGWVRLPIDRAFLVRGAGVVITGTLWQGSLRSGDHLEILPAGLSALVRGLEVHGEKVTQATAGQRVAINLPGVELAQVKRGAVLVSPETFQPTTLLDAEVTLLKVNLSKDDFIPNAWSGLQHNQRVRFHVGSSEVLGRVRVLDSEKIPPGDSGLVQFLAEEPLVVARGDRFILRSYSPVTTIGGGWILEAHPPRRRRFRPEELKPLLVRAAGDRQSILSQLLLEAGPPFVRYPDLIRQAEGTAAEIWPFLRQLVQEGEVILISEPVGATRLPPEPAGKKVVKGPETAELTAVSGHEETEGFRASNGPGGGRAASRHPAPDEPEGFSASNGRGNGRGTVLGLNQPAAENNSLTPERPPSPASPGPANFSRLPPIWGTFLLAHRENYRQQLMEIASYLDSFHALNPWRPGLPTEEFRSRFFPNFSGHLFTNILAQLEIDGCLANRGKLVARPGFSPRYSPEGLRLKNALAEECLRQPYAPPTIPEIISRLGIRVKEGDLDLSGKGATIINQAELNQNISAMVKALAETGELVPVTDEIVFHNQAIAAVKASIEEEVSRAGSISLAQLRDRLNTSRKFAQALLEYFDGIRFTRRIGDQRVLFRETKEGDSLRGDE
ncbi:MAG: selenocysteine-specific translation elongation factor [Firmicutes bacterium]|nr:selenocysteine-specific translation elongation factor [Bacillota bacterium]MCL5040285.1 selenocysteine-specific translation elongation factor [Bacillota bacterium]